MIKRLLSFVLLVSLTFAVFAQPAGYYDNATGKTGATLKTALKDIIKGHTVVSYDGLWTAFQTTDKKANGKVWDMYSNIEFTFGNNQCGNYSSEGDCYNREHSFPKSWFNDATPMYSDLFHLYPTDGFVNGKRSNYPFGEVSSPTYTSGNGSKLGSCSYPGYTGVVFEPVDEYKGDFARSYFYMVTRYEEVLSSWNTDMLDGSTFPAFSSWAKNMLMEWHQQDPVSQKEIDRNNAVYTFQNNRNPYIDHPEYAQAVWGNGTIELNFTSTPITTATQGQPYSYAVTVTGPVGATFIITAPTKPAWLTITAGTNGNATLSGTPVSAGSFNVELSVSDGTNTKTQPFTINVAAVDGLKFNSSPVLSAITGIAYSYNIVVTNQATPSADITISAPTKPNWLNLVSTGKGTATLSATPTIAGAYNVTLRAYDGTSTVEQSFTITVEQAGQTKTETFTNAPYVTSAYNSINWTGDDGSTWSSNLARTDSLINGRAICLKNAVGSYIQSGSLSGGCGSVSFKTRQIFSGSGGTLTLYINGNQIGSPFSYNTVLQTAIFSNINVSGPIVIKILNNGSARPLIDDVSWTGYSNVNDLPIVTNITTNPIAPTTEDDVIISAIATDLDGTITNVDLNWGLTEGNLSNTLPMTLDGSIYKATIPKQAAGTVYLSITAKDNSDATSTELYNYTVIVNQKPTITNISNTPTTPFAGQSIKISANIADGDGSIEDAWLNWGDSPSAMYNKLTLSLIDGKYETTIPSQSQAGTVYLSIGARDDKGGVSTSSFNITVEPNSIPTITNLTYSPPSPITGQPISISANITDSDGTIQEAWILWGTTADNLSNNVTMTLSEGKYSATIPAQTTAITLYFSIKAKDNIGVEIEKLFYIAINQNQLPSITNFVISPVSPTTGQTITVSATINDTDGNVQEAWVDWGNAANSLTNKVNMSFSAGSYSCTIPAQSAAGTVYLAITAKDNVSALSTASFNFNVTPATGIDENQMATVKVYPNPAKNSINIEINEQKATTITISNIIGETMLKMPCNGGKQPVDISMLKSGVYIVIVSGDDFRNTIRIVKY